MGDVTLDTWADGTATLTIESSVFHLTPSEAESMRQAMGGSDQGGSADALRQSVARYEVTTRQMSEEIDDLRARLRGAIDDNRPLRRTLAGVEGAFDGWMRDDEDLPRAARRLTHLLWEASRDPRAAVLLWADRLRGE